MTMIERRSREMLRFVQRLICVVALSSTLISSWSANVFGSGEVFTLPTTHDLVVDVDSRWVGCGQGGYCPVRVRVSNRGQARTLTFRILKSINYQPIAGVRQTVEVQPNETVALTLSVPIVNASNNAEFRVEESGSQLEGMKRNITLPDPNPMEIGRPGVIVVSPGAVDLTPLEDGVSTFRHTNGGTSSYSTGGGHYWGAYRNTNCLALNPSSLPGSWIDYSGVDLLFVPLEILAKLPKGTRTALAQWTRCGGTLVVTSAGEATTAEAISKVLVSDAVLASSWNWSEPKVEDRNVAQIVHQDTSGGITASGPPPSNVPGEWTREKAPFRLADVGFGKLVTFQNDPFPGVAQDWFWMIKSIGGFQRIDWGKRHGVSSRQGTSDFLLFLIPGIGGVPVIMFLVLITIFSIVIGPLNYFVLARRKQLHLLLLTIPGVAIVTSLLLFGYTIVAHGFSVKARCRSLTYVDQAAQAAVTMNRLSLYAGQAPSGGMKFSRDTAVYPIWPESEGFESGQLDWTNTQNLTSGWLRSRTRTQFLTVGHRTERGRLEVTPSGSGKLTVANGFEWGFEPLVVANEQGQLFIAKNLAAGDSIELNPATADEMTTVASSLQRYPLEVPVGLLSTGGSSSMFGSPMPHRRGMMYYPYGVTSVWHQHESLMEQALVRLRSGAVVPGNVSPEVSPMPRTFYGLATQTPHIELGVPKATEINSLHVVMGRW